MVIGKIRSKTAGRASGAGTIATSSENDPQPIAAIEDDTLLVSDALIPDPLASDMGVARRRDRLLASLTLIAVLGLLLGLPYALSAGREFFLPVTAATIVAIALVPLLEALERRRLPSPLAALVCVVLFLGAFNIALAAIFVPASEWVTMLPQRLMRIQTNIAPVIDLFKSLQHFTDDIVKRVVTAPAASAGQAAAPAPAPSSILELLATSAPAALIEMFYALLLVFFLLAGWTRLKHRTITSRGSFSGAMTTARVIRDVVGATSSYLGTITLINFSLGLIVAFVLWAIGMPSPLMWGGIVAFLNYIPYLGPIFAAVLLTLGGLMSFTDVRLAFLPAVLMVCLHLIEANAFTPFVVGRKLTINPVLILISISFWSWVWGPTGALLAVPLLIIIQTVAAAAGKPDIAGFLFEEGTLTRGGGD